MKTRVGIAMAAGLVVVAGCGATGLRTGAGTVEKETAAAFLTTAERDWHGQVDGEPVKNLSPAARCYFVTGADGNQSLGTMACGPLRRLGSAERQVWDVVRIETTGGDKPGLRLPDGEQWKKSQLRPDSSDLWRPDDKAADDDADALAAPQPPAAPTGLTSVTSKSETLELKAANGKLVVPDGTVTLKGIATPGTFGSGAQQVTPAAGEKFVVAVFGTSPTIDPLTGDAAYEREAAKRTPATKWTVTVGGQQRPVDILPGDQGTMTAEQTLLISVPKDSSEVLLTATSGPVVQSLSLTTGQRTTTDVAAAYYRTGVSADLNKSLPTTVRNVGSHFKSSFSLSLGKAALTPWDPARGWAPQGKAWARVQVRSTLDYSNFSYAAAWASPFLTATADGVAIPMITGDPDTGVIAIPVPATTKVLQLTAKTALRFNSRITSAVPRTGTASFPALTATAAFQ